MGGRCVSRTQGQYINNILLQLVRDTAPSGLDLGDQVSPLHDLLHHELHRHIQHVTF